MRMFEFHVSTESPVPLEFTPVLGILIGVVLTLFVIALVIILVLRLKYKSSVSANRKRYYNLTGAVTQQPKTRRDNCKNVPDSRPNRNC